MPYIGKQPEIGAYKKLDSITVVNGQAAYTLQSGSANYSPASANHLIVSLNGVIQAPQDSFTVSGSTLSFASNLSTGDSIDFVLALGDVLSVGTPSDNTITNDKLATAPTLISKGAGGEGGAIQLNCEVNSHGVKLKSPDHSAGQSWTLKLPDNSPTADKFLKVKSITGSGATAVGQMEFASAGSLTLLSSNTSFSGVSSVDFADVLQNYDVYFFLAKLQRASTGYLQFQFGTSGSTWVTASSYHTSTVYGSNGSVASTDQDSVGYGRLSSDWTAQQSTTETPFVSFGYIYNANDSNDYTYVRANSLFYSSSTNPVVMDSITSLNSAATHQSIKFYSSGGNLANGFVKLYGIS